MKTARLARLSLVLILCAFGNLTMTGDAAASSQETETSAAQARMRGIFITLTTVYNYSLDEEAFEDPANNMQIQVALQALVANAAELEQHGGGLDPSFGYLQRSLAKDAYDALDRFSQGQYMGSRFVISKMTENCVSCHTKLPSSGNYDIGAEFTAKSGIRKLKPEERVNLELATRQFSAAVKTYEEIFAKPEMTPENLALLGACGGYLRLCIGALDDPTRPIGTFQKYIQRKDITASQKQLVNGWIADLQTVDLRAAEGNELETARRLVNEAEAKRKKDSDRTDLVDYVTATTILHRYIETNPENDADVAEAFYLLGVAESRVTRSYWISETDFLLAQAIRTAPKSPIAAKAYDFLVEYTISAHMETSAREVSPELRANMEELKALIEE
jgi:hypothetical protein